MVRGIKQASYDPTFNILDRKHSSCSARNTDLKRLKISKATAYLSTEEQRQRNVMFVSLHQLVKLQLTSMSVYIKVNI